MITLYISGRYECKLKEKNVFKQQSKGEIIYKVLPIIQLKPMTVKIKCEAGKRVLVECSVNSPYMVEFKDLPVAGKPETNPKENKLVN